jgi:multisubunit Na+/H+ antiporter MnhB subunit
MKRIAIASSAAAFAAVLVLAILTLEAAPVRLPELVQAAMPAHAIAHPVTAVLLDFRGYDTLLEIAVLLLALLTIVAVRDAPPASASGVVPDAVLTAVARIAVPLMVMVGMYLLWAGAHRPGGAFQAAAVLAAAAVLLHLAGLLPAWRRPSLALRAALSAGFIVFLASATAMLAQGNLLQYPPAHTASLVLLIEFALTCSLALILAGLLLFLSES